jgi:ribosomal protein L11 methyltransferase
LAAYYLEQEINKMNNYKEIEIAVNDAQTKDVLIALLSNYNFDQFLEEENILKAYTQTDLFDEEIIKEIITQYQCTYKINEIEAKNWNQQWEQDYEPVVIKPIVAVHASFHKPIEGVQHNIVITPKMSFGTGHHATTHLMLEEISGINCTQKKVLDYGCGTGVLGIYTSILGAQAVSLCDIEEWCIENTIENCSLNKVINYTCYLGDIDIVSEGGFDIILANINLNILLAQLSTIKAASTKGAHVLLSGFYETDAHILIKKAGELDFTMWKSHNLNKWCMLHFINN